MVEITHSFDLIGGKLIEMAEIGLEMGLKRMDTGGFYFKLVEKVKRHVFDI